MKENMRMKPRVKCLLVDDLDENLLALSTLVERDDVEVLRARSGVEALEILLANEVALALIDVQMPGMDGFELAELMRGSERTRAIPIIFVTAGIGDQSRVFKGYEAGAVDFLYKPVEPRVLRNKVDVFFELSRQRQQLSRDLVERTETLRLHEMFTAVLGHDLRNPLSGIMMMAESIQRHATDETATRNAERILSSGKWMSRLINDMLDVARARLGGGIVLSRQRADLNGVVQQALQDLAAAFPDRQVEMVCTGDPAGDWDTDRLRQVASNLVGNALQHGAQGAAVIVRVDGRDPAIVRLHVQNGGRIPPDLLDHIFDPFRGGEPSHRGKGGLGLGLYIVQQIVSAHGGSVSVECTDDIPGTCFDVELPRLQLS